LFIPTPVDRGDDFADLKPKAVAQVSGGRQVKADMA
jgi:hypothetical protein